MVPEQVPLATLDGGGGVVSWGGLNPGAGTKLGIVGHGDGGSGGDEGDEGSEFHF